MEKHTRSGFYEVFSNIFVLFFTVASFGLGIKILMSINFDSTWSIVLSILFAVIMFGAGIQWLSWLDAKELLKKIWKVLKIKMH